MAHLQYPETEHGAEYSDTEAYCARRGGMPPMLRDTSMAMGVVTDLGASDMATSWLAPHIRATITTETMPDMQPTSDDTTSGTICFLIVESGLEGDKPYPVCTFVVLAVTDIRQFQVAYQQGDAYQYGVEQCAARLFLQCLGCKEHTESQCEQKEFIFRNPLYSCFGSADAVCGSVAVCLSRPSRTVSCRACMSVHLFRFFLSS